MFEGGLCAWPSVCSFAFEGYFNREPREKKREKIFEQEVTEGCGREGLTRFGFRCFNFRLLEVNERNGGPWSAWKALRWSFSACSCLNSNSLIEEEDAARSERGASFSEL